MARLVGRAFKIAVAILSIASVAFLIAPLLIIAGASFGPDIYIRFPPRGLTLQWYEELSSLTGIQESISYSLLIALMTMVIATSLGTIAAFGASRLGRARVAIESYFLIPRFLPEVVTGAALLLAFGITRLRSPDWNLLVGHTVLALPFVVASVAAMLRRQNRALEEAAMSLGANRLRTFARVVLPSIMPAIVTGAMFAFVISFNDFPVAVLLTPGGQATFPVQLYGYMRFSISPSIAAISTILVIATGLALIVLDRLIGLETLLGLELSTRRRRPGDTAQQQTARSP